MKANIRYSIIKNTVAAVTLGAVLALGQSAAQAQLGGLGKKKTDSGGGTAAFGKSADDAVGKVLAARIMFLDAKSKLMEALGLKTESVKKESEALRLKEGST